MSLRLPSVLSDHMVIQRDKPINVWGWASPGATVDVAFAGATVSGTAGTDGTWLVALPEVGAGGPHTLSVTDATSHIELKDVLVGEVWVCSGQSNMEWTLDRSRDARAEIAAANFPLVRMFTVEKSAQKTPQADCPGKWNVCHPQHAGAFSAVGYFFARKLFQEINVPIGMLHTSWGGTTAESWTSSEALEAEPSLRYLAEQARLGQALESLVPYVDPGRSAETAHWAEPDLDDSVWQPIQVPGTWQSQGGPNVNGAAWYRKSIDIPADWAGQDLTLSLGALDDVDDTFFNGTPVGQTTTATPNYWATLRSYTVHGSLVKPGKNVIAIRIFDHWCNGGPIGPSTEMFVAPKSGPGTLPLLTGWVFKVELGLPIRNSSSAVLPTHLYNGMVAPLLHAGIRGTIWYQGESNAGRAAEYRTLLPVMIRDWRKRFRQGDFDFHIVELANWQARLVVPAQSHWAELREAQHYAAKVVGHSTVSCTIDIGEADDIHPNNKQDVGFRLALLGLHDTYGKTDVISRGPVCAGVTFEGDTARIHFTHTGAGLKSSDTSRGVVGFAIRGAGTEFVWAYAKIDGDDVIISAPGVKKPTAVRYAWADNPDCTLVNSAGLPAFPFRTDGSS